MFLWKFREIVQILVAQILTYCLHCVSLLNKQLSSWDINVHSEGLLLLVYSIQSSCVLTENTYSIWLYLKVHITTVTWKLWEHNSNTFMLLRFIYLISISAKLFASVNQGEKRMIYKCFYEEIIMLSVLYVHIPRNLLSLCSLLLLLITSSTMKTMAMATRMQMMVTIIFRPSVACLFSWLGSTIFSSGAIVPRDM